MGTVVVIKGASLPFLMCRCAAVVHAQCKWATTLSLVLYTVAIAMTAAASVVVTPTRVPDAEARTPQKKQTLAPSHYVTRDVEFVPLTREFIELLDDKERYNRYATPNQYDGTATNVSMSMYIEGISSFSAQTMDYQLDMYFYQEWVDLRLRHNGTGPMLIRDKAVFKKLWHPDIYFANARQANFQEITEDNFLVWVYPSGRIWISLIAICMMDLWKYPLDSQTCELRILSYAYPESQLRLRWSHTISPPIDRNLDIRMPDMRLVDITMGECNGTYATGKWSCMTAVFYVQREMMHHIIQTYVPTALIVVISWFNFWLDIDSAPARVSLSITTLLTIATQANAVKLSLPEVSYMKAIDFWLGMCMTFVFGVMVEYTIAHFAKNQEMCRGMPMPSTNAFADALFGNGGAGGNGMLLSDGAPATSPIVGTMLYNTASPTAGNHQRHPSSGGESGGGATVLEIHPSPSTTLIGGCRRSISAQIRKSLRRRRSTGSTENAALHMIPMRSKLAQHLPKRQQCNNVNGTDGGYLRPDQPDVHTILQYNDAIYGDDEEDEDDEEEFMMASGYSGGLESMPQPPLLTVNHGTPLFRKYNGNSGSTNNGIRFGGESDVRLRRGGGNADGGSKKYDPLTGEIVEVAEHKLSARPKMSYRDSMVQFRKKMSRRAHYMRKSLCNIRGRAMANKIDQKSRVVFPTAFILVNIGYWSYYLVFN